jgi:hypothetical protein
MWFLRRIYNASLLLASSVKKMGIQRHTELRIRTAKLSRENWTRVQLSVRDSHGKFIVEEELEVGL